MFRGRSYHDVHFQYRKNGKWVGFGEELRFLGDEWDEIPPGETVKFTIAIEKSLTPDVCDTWVTLFFGRDAEAKSSFWLQSPPLLTKTNKLP